MPNAPDPTPPDGDTLECWSVLAATPGLLPRTAQERGGVIPAAAEFLASFVEAGVPKMSIVLRKGYGGALIVMNARDLA